MLVYAKDINVANFEDVIIDEKEKEKFDRKDDKGSYKLRLYLNYNKPEISGRDINPEGWYPFYVSKDLKIITLEKKSGYIEVWPIDNGIEKSWQTSRKTAQERILAGEIICEKNKKGELEIFFKDREHQRYLTHWFDSKYNATHYGTRLLEKTLGEKVKFSYPKSLYSVLDTLKIMTKNDDIILDFFAGSGTTGHAVLELNKEDGGNRKFILVEQLNEHIEVCKERIQKVLQKESIESDFVYLELMKWNENFVEKIQKAKTKEELKKLWETMKEKAFLSYKVDIQTVDKNAKDFEDLSIEDQKRFLLECLDKNHLYVNYSEIDDEEYGVSAGDKKLNKEFYG
jgi:adenine-specific DNA-methyltransferase